MNSTHDIVLLCPHRANRCPWLCRHSAPEALPWPGPGYRGLQLSAVRGHTDHHSTDQLLSAPGGCTPASQEHCHPIAPSTCHRLQRSAGMCVFISLHCCIIHLFDRQVMPVLVNVNGNWVLVYRPFQNPLIVCFWPHDPAWLLPFHPLVSSFHSFSPPLQALSDRFCGEIFDDKIPLYSFFPDEYFTCSSVCLSCK